MKCNVYLESYERKQLEQIKQKYQVSLSTIAEKTAFYLMKYYAFENKDIKDIFTIKFSNSTNRTSIKPKNNLLLKAQIEKYGNSPNIIYTNALKFYLDRNLLKEKIKTEELRNKYFMEIDRELQKTTEPNWNYNAFKRNYYRVLKENE